MTSRFLYISIHVLLWGGICYLMLPEWGLGAFEVEFLFTSREALPYFAYGAVLNAILFYSYSHIVLPPFWQNNSLMYLLAFNAFFLFGFTAIEGIIDFFYTNGIYEANGTPAPLTLRDHFATDIVVTGSVLLGANLYGFSFGWFKSQQQRRELEQAKLEAELSALKHQIHPHFLFNILNGLYGLAFQNEDEPTAEGIAKLSGMMRYVLYESNDDTVPLEKEVEYMRNYIDLQRLRLDKSTEVDFSVRGDITGKKIAPMLLIPFIENAFKHGVSTMKSTKIEIFVNLLGQDLIFDVRNPILRTGRGRSNTPGGIGLQNVQKRLEILYPKQHELRIQDQNDTYHVHLTLGL